MPTWMNERGENSQQRHNAQIQRPLPAPRLTHDNITLAQVSYSSFHWQTMKPKPVHENETSP